MKSMLAVRYEHGAGLRLEEIPVPQIGPDEALVAVEAASICATDIRIANGGHRKYGPGTVRTPGHEIAGRVVCVGRKVTGIREGDRVFVAPNIGCGECAACRRGKNNLCPDYQAFGITMDGGFAARMRVPAAALEQGSLVPIGEDVDAAEIALAEPLACVLHGQEAVQTGPGDTVVVQGAGPIGLLHILLARARGADRVLASDLSPARRAMARRLGADAAVDPVELEATAGEATSGAGAEVVISAAPSAAAQQQALALAAPGGRINFFAGLPKDIPPVALDSNAIHYRELRLTGTTGCSTDDCRRAAALVLARRIDLKPLITARFPLRDALAAFGAAQSPEHLKIVLDVDSHANSSV